MNKKNQQNFIQNKECFSRMNFLYQAAVVMSGTNNTLSSYYGQLCRNVAKKAVLRIDPQVKRSLCKRCSLAVKPGQTADIAVQQGNSATKRNRRRRSKAKNANIDHNAQIQVVCRQCGYRRNFNLNGNYNMWLDQPECIAEVQSLKTDKLTHVAGSKIEEAQTETAAINEKSECGVKRTM